MGRYTEFTHSACLWCHGNWLGTLCPSLSWLLTILPLSLSLLAWPAHIASKTRVWEAGNGGRESQLGVRLDTTSLGPFKGSLVPGTISVAPSSGTVSQGAGTEAWHMATAAVLQPEDVVNKGQCPCHSNQQGRLKETWMPETHLHTRLITAP